MFDFDVVDTAYGVAVWKRFGSLVWSGLVWVWREKHFPRFSSHGFYVCSGSLLFELGLVAAKKKSTEHTLLDCIWYNAFILPPTSSSTYATATILRSMPSEVNSLSIVHMGFQVSMPSLPIRYDPGTRDAFIIHINRSLETVSCRLKSI